jgi:predicted peptidase
MHSESHICLALLPLSLALLACFQTRATAESWQDSFEAKKYENAKGESLPYRLLKPERTEPGKSYPLVLFLHGAGERGIDNSAQLLHGVGQFAKPENRKKHACFVVAPQCPTDRRWVEVDWALPSHTMPKTPSVPLRLTFELLDQLTAELPVDKSRLYITGLSMGGFGTWDAIARRPDCFAAAVPVCGGGDVAEALKLKSLPIWAFHGDRDSVVQPRRTPDMIAAIRQAGGAPRMTIYPGVDHDSWTATYANPAMVDWLFTQKR